MVAVVAVAGCEIKLPDSLVLSLDRLPRLPCLVPRREEPKAPVRSGKKEVPFKKYFMTFHTWLESHMPL